jgi:hypothetical protein
VIGVEAKREVDVPENMVKIAVPAALYAVAEVPLDVPAIHRAWDYLLGCGCLRQATLMLVPVQTILSSTRKSVAAKCGSP